MPRKVRQSHQIPVSVYKDKDKRVTILASGLSFVFLSAFFNLFIVAFERAVVVQQILELAQQVLQIVMLLLLLSR